MRRNKFEVIDCTKPRIFT